MTSKNNGGCLAGRGALMYICIILCYLMLPDVTCVVRRVVTSTQTNCVYVCSRMLQGVGRQTLLEVLGIVGCGMVLEIVGRYWKRLSKQTGSDSTYNKCYKLTCRRLDKYKRIALSPTN